MVVDSTIVKTFGYTESRIPGFLDILFFIIFISIFIISNVILVRLTNRILRYTKKNPPKLRILNAIISTNQFVISGILIIIIIQIIVTSSYERNFLISIIYLAFVSSIVVSVVMVTRFLQWFRGRKRYLLLLYVISFSLLIIKSSVAIVYLQEELIHHGIQVKPQQTRLMILNLSNINAELSEKLRTVYDYSSIIFFMSIWITTSIMLREYSVKLGKLKYWLLMGIPLIFFLLQDYVIGLSIFKTLLLYSPNLLATVYTIFPNIVQLIVGICFGLGILNGLRAINNENISSALMISAIGIVLLVGSFEIFGVFVGAYPPYGLVTISYMGLASFLLLIGIFLSAKSISSDVVVKNRIYKLVDSQILKNIGISEIRNQIVNNHEKILKIAEEEKLEINQDEYTKDELKQIVEDVINELKTRRTR